MPYLLTVDSVGGVDVLTTHERADAEEAVWFFDGTVWTQIAELSRSTDINAMVWHNDGTGSKLFVMGGFESFNGQAIASVAIWDGQSWIDGGAGSGGHVSTAVIFEKDGREVLYATSAAGLIRWESGQWQSVPYDGSPYPVKLLGAADLGRGNRLIATEWAWYDEDTGLWAWDGEAWEELPGIVDGVVHAVAPGVVDGMPGVFVGGQFAGIGDVAAVHTAFWDGRRWHSAGTTAPGVGLRGVSRLLSVGTEGGELFGNRLYAGGYLSVNERDMGAVAAWDGVRWESLGLPTNGQANRITSLLLADLGEGERLIAGGRLWDDSVMQWDGSSWSAVGPNPRLGDAVRELVLFDDGTGEKLYACGWLSVGWSERASVVRLGDQGWEIVLPMVWGWAQDMVVFDDGQGPALYVCGQGGVDLGQGEVGPVIKLTPDGWEQAGDTLYHSGDIGEAYRLVTIEVDGRRMLSVSGSFELDGVWNANFALLDGGVWEEGTGYIPDETYVTRSMETEDGLVVLGGTSVNGERRVSVYQDGGWGVLPGVMHGSPGDLAFSDVDGSPSLYISGWFTHIDDLSSDGFARFGCERCPVDFDADGDADSSDVAAFLDLWLVGDIAADMNRDGSVDTRDVVEFLNLWNAGC